MSCKASCIVYTSRFYARLDGWGSCKPAEKQTQLKKFRLKCLLILFFLLLLPSFSQGCSYYFCLAPCTDNCAGYSPSKQPLFPKVANWALTKLCLNNERRNSILMACDYPDLASASDWLEFSFNQSEALPRSGLWPSKEFLHLLCRRRFARVQVATWGNVGCFLRLCRLRNPYNILFVHFRISRVQSGVVPILQPANK